MLPLYSCSGEQPLLITDPGSSVTVHPGGSVTVIFSVAVAQESGNPSDVSGFTKSSVSRFSQPARADLFGEGFSISGTEQSAGPEGISAVIIVAADEDLLSGNKAELRMEWGGMTSAAVIECRKNPVETINAEGVITDPDAYDALINKKRRLPAGYVPSDLVRLEVPTILTFEEVNHLRKIAAEALSEMFRAAEKEKGYLLTARSGYRSYKTQVSLYRSNVDAHGLEYARMFSAQPGTSEHQSGLAIDITSPSMNYRLEQVFGETDEGRWVSENAHRFGFIIRYPEGKENITGYAYEPWHLRYTGPILAEEIYRRDLTLEEYFFE